MYPTETWELDGADWVASPASTAPSGRAHHALVYSAGLARAVLFGGWHWTGSQHVHSDETWEYDGTEWLPRAPGPSPEARSRHDLAFHERRNRVVLFGGLSADGLSLGDTWEYDGQTWARLDPIQSPPPRYAASMAYHPGRNRVVLFGGWCPSGVLRDTWELGWVSGETPERCDNAEDDDGDGLVDCADPDCHGSPACGTPEDCSNGTDDDGDGLVDCADPGCGGSICGPSATCVAGECR
jgi:hypothetical protein